MALKKQYQDEVNFIVADFNKEETFALIQAERYDVPYIPIFFFIDGRGNIILNEAGVFSYEDVAQVVELLIN